MRKVSFESQLVADVAPSLRDWHEYIREFHDIRPGVTRRACAVAVTEVGKTSYELLAEDVSLPTQSCHRTILDLGCGDGFLSEFIRPRMGIGDLLVGVDMSIGEVAAASAQFSTQRICFLRGVAQHLPLADESIDTALSHMAFMYMLPCEPVVAELARVLKSRGRFSAVIGAPLGGGVWMEVQRLSFSFLHNLFPALKHAPIGDPRFGSLEGLNNIFGTHLSFGSIECNQVHEFNQYLEVLQAWSLIESGYLIAMLTEEHRGQLRKQTIDLLSRHADLQGRVKLTTLLRHFSVTKR